jgi:Secretion system C-terminal sorting domain
VRLSGLIFLASLFFWGHAFSQLKVVPIEKSYFANPHPTARVMDSTVTNPDSTGTTTDSVVRVLKPMLLPFWDDFSFSNSVYYPHDSLWLYGNSVLLNFGIGINPPSLGVVTFDGLDSLGLPYSVTDALAKGYADNLISRGIRLDTLPPSQRDSVWLSFFYEYNGNGEPPDPGDVLTLDFLNDQGNWENIGIYGGTDTLQSNIFLPVNVHVNEDRFFHSNFQFRFRNFGRLSGPYDTWNLDYVYLNSGRDSLDMSFPDRTIATPMTTMLGEYWSIPKKHFLTDVNANLSHPSFDIYNLRVGNDQPLDFYYSASVVSYKSSVKDSVDVLLDSAATAGALEGLQRMTVTTSSVPSASLFDPKADSFKINLKIALTTKDNVRPSHSGDYDSAKYYPIDFRLNDTTRSVQYLKDYYAYDDGTAEYGIGLNQPGTEVAYKFNMKTPDPDTIVAVDIYFPHFGDESAQILLLRVTTDLTDSPSSILYEDNINVTRSDHNKFVRFPLDVNTIGVQGSFYIGWKQTSSASIPVGWDKNTNSGNKIFYNINGGWIADSTDVGSMMVRPVFGKGQIVTGLPEVAKNFGAFPNPNSGVFYIPTQPDQIAVFDMAGRSISFTSQNSDHQTRVEMNHAVPGIYIVKTLYENEINVQRIMVRP